MLKNILCTLLICITAFVSGSMFRPATATASDYDASNPKKHTFLFFVQGLNDSDLNGPGLPNMKKLKSEGISYQHLTKNVPARNQDAITEVLGLQDNRLLLTQTLADNGVDCMAVDGTGTITNSPAKESQLKLIKEKNDQLAVDKYLDAINEHLYQFTVIYLDDTSKPDKSNSSSTYHRWSLADNQVGRVLNQLLQLDKLSNSTIIITGGGDTPPLIIFNNSNNQAESFYHCHQLDIAPTICKIHGVTPPAAMPGHVLYESLPQTPSKSLTNNLKLRICDLQEDCHKYNQQISMFQEEQQAIQKQKAELKEERENISRIISEKDNNVQQLSLQIKILKFLGVVIFIILLIGYIVLYRWLRKKFLIFP